MEAATKYLNEAHHKITIDRDRTLITQLEPYIHHLYIDEVHNGTMAPFVAGRLKEGVKTRTINYGLQVARRILNLAAREWFDDNNQSWLASAPLIKMLPETDLRKPYPITWEEQDRLFAHLPEHLRDMSLFVVNTGCRDKMICSLKWDHEIKIPELNTSIFFIPAEIMKAKRDHIVVLNDIARDIIESQRGKHPEYVFTFRGKPIHGMNNSAWRRARKNAGLVQVRVHDLRHTFGRRLRAAGVGVEDREDLLGHKSNRMTTHYSAAEIANLISAVNKLCNQRASSPTLIVLRKGIKNQDFHKISTRSENDQSGKSLEAL